MHVRLRPGYLQPMSQYTYKFSNVTQTQNTLLRLDLFDIAKILSGLYPVYIVITHMLKYPVNKYYKNFFQ